VQNAARFSVASFRQKLSRHVDSLVQRRAAR
jgi:hypothetical protein